MMHKRPRPDPDDDRESKKSARGGSSSASPPSLAGAASSSSNSPSFRDLRVQREIEELRATASLLKNGIELLHCRDPGEGHQAANKKSADPLGAEEQKKRDDLAARAAADAKAAAADVAGAAIIAARFGLGPPPPPRIDLVSSGTAAASTSSPSVVVPSSSSSRALAADATLLLRGPMSCPLWGKAVFEVYVFFPPDFPFEAPTVVFAQPIFHPNVDAEDGTLCVRVLAEDWSPTYRLESILQSVRATLSDPNYSPENSRVGLGARPPPEAGPFLVVGAENANGRGRRPRRVEQQDRADEADLDHAVRLVLDRARQNGIPAKLYHYTTQQSAVLIRAEGILKPSVYGARGPGVYTTCLHPSQQSKGSVLQNNGGRGSDVVVELDTERLMRAGHAIYKCNRRYSVRENGDHFLVVSAETPMVRVADGATGEEALFEVAGTRGPDGRRVNPFAFQQRVQNAGAAGRQVFVAGGERVEEGAQQHQQRGAHGAPAPALAAAPAAPANGPTGRRRHPELRPDPGHVRQMQIRLTPQNSHIVDFEMMASCVLNERAAAHLKTARSYAVLVKKCIRVYGNRLAMRRLAWAELCHGCGMEPGAVMRVRDEEIPDGLELGFWARKPKKNGRRCCVSFGRGNRRRTGGGVALDLVAERAVWYWSGGPACFNNLSFYDQYNRNLCIWVGSAGLWVVVRAPGKTLSSGLFAMFLLRDVSLMRSYSRLITSKASSSVLLLEVRSGL